MEIVIREMHKNDFNSVYRLIQNELGYETLDAENTYKRLEYMNNHPDYKTFVSENDDEIIGFIGLKIGLTFEIDGKYLRIMAFAINTKYQNKGIGTQLIEKAEQYARQEKVNVIFLSSGFQREEAHRFYEGKGYIKKGFSFKKYLDKQET